MLLVIPTLDFDALLADLISGYIDPLTECLNARAFAEMRSQSHDQRLLYYFDLDDLKAINDRDGHQAGDDYIRDSAARLKDKFRRNTDIICRVGGDEFIVISDYPADLVGLGSFSFGVALIQDNFEAAIAQADTLMYQNKRAKKCKC
jgi:GGDEF domain-containing protein